jgi:hypothetical protein
MTYEYDRATFGLGAAPRTRKGATAARGTLRLQNMFSVSIEVNIQDMSGGSVRSVAIPPRGTKDVPVPAGSYRLMWTATFTDSGPSLGRRFAGIGVRAGQTTTKRLSSF